MTGVEDAISANDVAAQVDRILTSPELGRSERLKKFLSFTVSETLAGRDGHLKEYTIAIEAFDRDESFDPQTSNIVRVEAGRLRRRLEAYYNGSGRYDPIRIDLPKGGYVPKITPLVDDDGNGGAVTAEPNATADEVADVDTLIEVPYGPSIAVLPFDNMSGDPGQAFFVDGITEEIITDLARFKDLFVIARNTVFQYKGKAVDVRTLGRELGAEYVLEGSVRKAGDRVRLTAQLIDASTGAHVWAETFDRTLSPQNLIDVQDELSNEVVARIAQPYGAMRRARPQRRGSTDLSAYEAVLQFYAYWACYHPEEHLNARRALERAVEVDPDYADAWGTLALLGVDEARFGFNPHPDGGDALTRAEAHARRGLEANPECTTALQALMSIYFHQHETDKFREFGERALKANPNHTDMLADFGFGVAFSGDWERGLALVDKAIALSPLHPEWYHFARVMDYFRRGEYEAALTQAFRAEAPNFYWTHALQATIYGKLGRSEQGDAAIARLLEINPVFPDRIWYELRLWFESVDIRDEIVDGLRKAGLDVPDPD